MCLNDHSWWRTWTKTVLIVMKDIWMNYIIQKQLSSWRKTARNKITDISVGYCYSYEIVIATGHWQIVVARWPNYCRISLSQLLSGNLWQIHIMQILWNISEVKCNDNIMKYFTEFMDNFLQILYKICS